jgi:hypothetical protein
LRQCFQPGDPRRASFIRGRRRDFIAQTLLAPGRRSAASSRDERQPQPKRDYVHDHVEDPWARRRPGDGIVPNRRGAERAHSSRPVPIRRNRVESGSGAAIYAITTISRTLDSSSARAASHADYEGFLSPVPSIRAFASDFTSAAPIEDYSAFAKSDFTLSYYLEVMGPGAGTVPVEVTADGRAVGNATASFDVECSGCALGATVKSPPLNAWLLHTEFLATSGELYEIDLIADADPPSGDYKGTIFMASAEVDPYFRIDPSFADAAQYSLIFSPGVSDVAPGGVPELPVWMMLLMGMAGVGLMRSASFRVARTTFGLMALTVGIAVMGDGTGQRAARAQGIPSVDARLVAVHIPGASAIADPPGLVDELVPWRGNSGR